MRGVVAGEVVVDGADGVRAGDGGVDGRQDRLAVGIGEDLRGGQEVVVRREGDARGRRGGVGVRAGVVVLAGGPRAPEPGENRLRVRVAAVDPDERVTVALARGRVVCVVEGVSSSVVKAGGASSKLTSAVVEPVEIGLFDQIECFAAGVEGSLPLADFDCSLRELRERLQRASDSTDIAEHVRSVAAVLDGSAVVRLFVLHVAEVVETGRLAAAIPDLAFDCQTLLVPLPGPLVLAEISRHQPEISETIRLAAAIPDLAFDR